MTWFDEGENLKKLAETGGYLIWTAVEEFGNPWSSPG
jgi:hypothetical protein